jgi:hypothetical protein
MRQEYIYGMVKVDFAKDLSIKIRKEKNLQQSKLIVYK